MGSRLEFRILGPLEVLLDDVPVRVGGPRQRALLALLLCSANRVVSRERLIDALLGDQPADGAEQTLRVQVSRLRKALAGGDGDGESRLLASPPGYMLRVEPGELDLQAFEQHVADGRRALKQDDCQHAAIVLREAEAMWRGRPLADLEFEPFARLEAQRLEDLRLYAVEERVDAELALGEHAALCPELESLVAEHPLRERLRSQLMLALYRSSRQADALEAYTAGRLLLVGELALEPGPQLRQLQQAILKQDPSLELSRPAGRAGSALAVTAPATAAPPVQAASPADGAAPDHRELEPMPQRARRPRAGWTGLMLVVVVALSVLAIVEGAGGSTGPHRPVSGNALALISPVDGAVEATVPLSAADGCGRRVWVAVGDRGARWAPGPR
jgi:DNA-binding SARP family transcriptional activator